jgi:hypothetical protein
MNFDSRLAILIKNQHEEDIDHFHKLIKSFSVFACRKKERKKSFNKKNIYNSLQTC